MARKAILTLKRGDGADRTFKQPIAQFQEGSTLGFTAKPFPDNNEADTTAVINKLFDSEDEGVVDTTTDPNYAIWNLHFGPEDTNSIEFEEGVSKNVYTGEFQYVASEGAAPKSYPGDNNYIEVIVFADVRREVP